MEALGALAVAARDIRVLSTARTDSRPLKRLHEREPASPFQSARHSTAPAGHTPPQPIRSLAPLTRSSLARCCRGMNAATARATAAITMQIQ